jgi:phosphoserine phosphatase RsbU/P
VPFLRVEQGSCPGQLLEVAGERVVIGRHPGCEIVLDNAAVSRQHAQISESHGSYFLEDLRSRNKTFLNGRPVDGTAELHDGDSIEFCDLAFRFYAESPPEEKERPTAPAPFAAVASSPPIGSAKATVAHDGEAAPLDAFLESGSSILSTVPLNEASSLLLAVKPEQKLRAVLDIGRSLGHALELSDVLEKTLAGLFRVFLQADHGFVLLKEGEKGKLVVRAAKSRKADDAAPSVSMTVVRRAMKTGEAILSADVTGDSRFEGSDSIPMMSLRSVMCVPLFSQGDEPFGIVQLDCDDASRSFTKDDLDVLASVAGQIGLAVENARLHTELVAQ